MDDARPMHERSSEAPDYPAGFDVRRPVKSFGLTVYEMLVHPRRFYSRLKTDRSEYPAMAFLYVLAALVVLVATTVEAATGSTLLYVDFFVERPDPGVFPQDLTGWETARNIVGLSLLAPLSVIVGNYIWVFVVHAVAWVYMGRRAGNVKHTFRVIAYSNVVGIAALVVPFLGGVVATVWALYLLVVGVRRLNPRASAPAAGG